MKLIVLFLIAFCITARVYATTPTDTPTASPTEAQPEKTQQIEDLKERLATKVAQLRQTQRKALFGTIKAVSISTITVETKTSDVKIELTDEIKIVQIIKGTRTELGEQDLAKGDVVSVFGDYGANLDLLRAKIIFIQGTFATKISGIVQEVDEKNFVLTIETPEKQLYTIDVERTTATTMWAEDKGLEKSGFSKIEVGHVLHITGTSVPKKDRRISATRIVNLGTITQTTPLTEKAEEASPPATPSVKSTPTVLITPKSTSSPTPEP